ncbi:hypothetical protein ACVPOR_14480 [Staphylococcus aureus]
MPADSRDLNYSNYVETGNEKITQSYEYNSDHAILNGGRDKRKTFNTRIC